MASKKNSRQWILHLITAVFLFGFTTLFSLIYEEKNTLIGLSVALMMITLAVHNMGITRRQTVGLLFGYFLGSVILSQVASLHPLVGIGVNLLAILAIMLLFTEQVQAAIYLPFLLLYVFAVGNPCGVFDFLLRFIGLFVAFLLVSGWYLLMHPKREDRNRTVKTIVTHIEPQTERFSLAIKTALTLSLTALVCGFCPQASAGYAVFMALVVLQLMVTDLYTADIPHPGLVFIAVIVAALAFYLFVPQQYFIFVFALFCVLFGFIPKYRMPMVFICVSAMGVVRIVLDINTPIPWRVVPLIAALIIPVLIGKIPVSKIVFRIKDTFFPPDYTTPK